ncbi:alpha/beta hydrolase fold domain-containing protein [Nocardia xishanensis]|uniref:Alpha/beta hydrolase n=1 Tax=Nocardia xishanensis TaxID=238964 RepID=A0ABW7XBM8_9NOCA
MTETPSSRSVDVALTAMIAALSAAEIIERREDGLSIPIRPAPIGVDDRETAFEDPSGGHRVRNVTTPTITPYLPDPAVATGAAMIVAPGGGFFMLSMDSEGTEVAEWLRDRGVAAFVLKYRLRDAGSTQAEFAERFVSELVAAHRGGSVATGVVDMAAFGQRQAVDDVARAVEVVRERAGEWGIDPHRVGVIGFSAGAYAAAAVLGYVDADQRPDALACIYGGRLSAQDLRDIPPPLFTAVGARDALCAGDVLTLVDAWRTWRASLDAHVYDSADHGFGMRRTGGLIDTWIDRFEDWLTGLGFIAASHAEQPWLRTSRSPGLSPAPSRSGL